MSDTGGGMLESALVVKVPAAEPAVSQWRQMYDPAATWGVPAHITILYPFVSPAEIDNEVTASLTRIFAAAGSFDFELDEVGKFGTEVLILRPNPSERFVALTASIVDAWPEHQPYEGVHKEVIPHLTVAHTNRGASFNAISTRIAEHLPILCRAAEVSLMTGSLQPGSWSTVADFALD